MKTVNIRCDICNLELYLENESGQFSFHVPIRIEGVIYGNDANYKSHKLHFCSPKCVAWYLEKQVVQGTPLDEDRLRSLAEKITHSCTTAESMTR